MEDDRAAVGEEAVLAAWNAKFGQPLTTQFFSDYSFKDQDKTKPTHYKVKDPASGLMIQAPYQIIYFKIGPEYAGPYVDYEIVTEEETKDGETFNVTKLKITQPEGKKFALGKGDSLWLHCRTPYAKYTKQNMEIIEEVEEQRVLKEAGLSDLDTLVYNPLNNPPEENTAAAAEAAQEADRLRKLALLEPGTPGTPGTPEPPKPKLPRGAKYVRSEDKWKLNPRYYVRESQLENAGFLGGIKSTLAGFTNSRDFYVEDVTQKWGASGSSGLAGLGLLDSSEENLEDIQRYAGEITKAAANTVVSGSKAGYHFMNQDYDEVAKNAVDIGKHIARLPYNAAQLNRNVQAYGVSSAVEGGVDLVNDVADSLGGYSSNGLGDGWDKAADVGEGVGKFVRGTARGIAPEALTEGIDEGISELTGRFTANPVPYTLLVGGALIMVTPLGGFLARNLTTLGGGMINLIPAAAKAIPESIGGAASGIIDGSKRLGNSVVGTSSRGTAARRRRNKRR